MPKTTRPRVRHVDNTAYHRQSGRQTPKKNCKRNGCVRLCQSSDGDRKFGLHTSASREDRLSSSDAGALRCVNRRQTSPGALLPGSCSPKEALAVSETVDETCTYRATTPTHCEIPGPTTPCPSESSTIVDSPDHGIFAGVSRTARLEEFEFEFESVVRIDGDQCQVRWADSIVRDSDLHSRRLHGEPLLNCVASAVPLGGGLSKVTWELTWEPVDVLRGYKDVVERDLQFEYGDVIEEQGGRSLVRWEKSVIHESTLEALHGHPLLNHMHSLSKPLSHGYCVAAWRPMWVPSHIMEAHGGKD